MANELLLQTGDRLLLQDGFALLLQLSDVPVPVAGKWRTVRQSRTWRANRRVDKWRCVRLSRTWRAVGPVMNDLVDNALTKTPGDIAFRFVMDFSEVLRSVSSSATITSVSSVAVSPSGPTISGSQVDTGSKAASCLIAGGTSETDYDVTFTVVFSTNQTCERTGVLRVRTK